MDSDLSRFKVKQPCRNCPFRTDDTRIRFGDRERAEEIEEHAYRRGFACHETAETHEDPVTGDESLDFGEHSSHCAGYIVMRLKGGAAAGRRGRRSATTRSFRRRSASTSAGGGTCPSSRARKSSSKPTRPTTTAGSARPGRPSGTARRKSNGGHPRNAPPTPGQNHSRARLETDGDAGARQRER